MSQRLQFYNGWGTWTDTAHHLMGQGADEEMQFGVSLFNGLPQPWARGTYPRTPLANNRLS